MTILFVILVLLVALVLGFFVLVQNPKGGGLSGNVAGFSNQFMGVKQTTDVLEKGTWIFAGALALLCMFAGLFIQSGKSSNNGLMDKVNTSTSAPILNKPAATTAPAAAPIQDTSKK